MQNNQPDNTQPGSSAPGDNKDAELSAPALQTAFFDNLDENLVNKFQNLFFWSLIKNGAEEKAAYSKNIIGLTGYKPEEIYKKPGRMLALIHEDDLPAYKQKYFDFLNNPGSSTLNIEYRIQKKNREICWFSESIAVKRDLHGNARLLNGVVTDITPLKDSHESLLASFEALKEKNEAKDKFLSILSHDLRSPFTSILGFSEILITESNLSPAERQEYLSYIHDSSQNQLQLINYLLDWTRLQTGRIKIEPVRINAQALVFNCISSLTGNAIRKNLDIKANIDENLFISADERLMTQVITNLLSNAIKFSPDGKTIDVSADSFNDEFIEFIVKDYGTGISENNQQKLFKIDKMFSTEGTKGEKGTGLGLSLVKEIVEKHNGKIWFYSEPGAGSEFHLTVPGSLNSILVVESNPSDRVFFEKILRKFFPSFQVIIAENGFDAMEIAQKKAPSLIIANHEMPMMSGMQLMESLHHEEKKLIPFIILSNDNSGITRFVYEDQGAEFILQKPVDVDLLCEKIKDALHKF
jgi:PAS domain S-box-containing protein